MSDGYVDLSFGENDNNIGSKSKKFKGKEGEKYRISLVWFHTNPDGSLNFERPRFTACERFFLNGVGYFLNRGPEYAKIAGGPPKQTVGTIIVKWPTDRNGSLDKASFTNGTGYEVLAWIFSGKKYQQMKAIHDEFPVGEHDIKIDCEDTQYQKMSFTPTKESLFTTLANNPKGAAIVAAIREEVNRIASSLATEMAQDLTLDQIRERLAGEGGATPVVTGAAENVDNLLDDLGV